MGVEGGWRRRWKGVEGGRASYSAVLSCILRFKKKKRKILRWFIDLFVPFPSDF